MKTKTARRNGRTVRVAHASVCLGPCKKTFAECGYLRGHPEEKMHRQNEKQEERANKQREKEKEQEQKKKDKADHKRKREEKIKEKAEPTCKEEARKGQG